MFTVTTPYATYQNCTLALKEYANKHVAIQIFCEEGPLATITVNIPDIQTWPSDCSCVDTNNCPWAEALIEELDIGIPLGFYYSSGYCEYPVYQFNPDKIKEYC